MKYKSPYSHKHMCCKHGNQLWYTETSKSHYKQRISTTSNRTPLHTTFQVYEQKCGRVMYHGVVTCGREKACCAGNQMRAIRDGQRRTRKERTERKRKVVKGQHHEQDNHAYPCNQNACCEHQHPRCLPRSSSSCKRRLQKKVPQSCSLEAMQINEKHKQTRSRCATEFGEPQQESSALGKQTLTIL